MTFAIHTAADEPLYWTHAGTPARAWWKFCSFETPARAAIVNEALSEGYTAHKIDLNVSVKHLERLRRSDERRMR